MKKRIVSLLLALALLVLPVVSAGAAQPAAADPTPVQTQTDAAAESDQHCYSYIALGDSIVAGIGLPDAVYQRNGRYYDVSGNYQGYSKDCYVARVADSLGLSRAQTANYGMPALMSSDLLELVRTGSCQSASINFSLPDLREELKHAQVITVEIGANDVLVPIMYGIASAMGGPQVFEALLPILECDILSVLCTPVTENTTHSAIFTAWSPIRSKYFATMRVSIAFSPFALSAAISSIILSLVFTKSSSILSSELMTFRARFSSSFT